MVEEIGGVSPYPKSPEEQRISFNLNFYAEEILKNFLISKKTPTSQREKEEIENIFKKLSLLIWLGRSRILTPNEERNIAENLKDLYENFRSNTLEMNTDNIIQKLKNL